MCRPGDHHIQCHTQDDSGISRGKPKGRQYARHDSEGRERPGAVAGGAAAPLRGAHVGTASASPRGAAHRSEGTGRLRQPVPRRGALVPCSPLRGLRRDVFWCAARSGHACAPGPAGRRLRHGPPSMAVGPVRRSGRVQAPRRPAPAWVGPGLAVTWAGTAPPPPLRSQGSRRRLPPRGPRLWRCGHARQGLRAAGGDVTPPRWGPACGRLGAAAPRPPGRSRLAAGPCVRPRVPRPPPPRAQRSRSRWKAKKFLP